MLPQLAECLRARGMQCGEVVEELVRSALAEVTEDLLGGVQFRTVRGQGHRHKALRPSPLPTPMARRVGEHQADPLVRPLCP